MKKNGIVEICEAISINTVIPECFCRESRDCANPGPPTKTFGGDKCKVMLAMTLICSFLFPITVNFATPPVSIDLKYDLDTGSLHVEAVHPSFNLDKSYVRLMNVYVNGKEVLTRNYFRQKDYEKFSDDVPVIAQVGDIIKVELFCSLGGDMSKELTVTDISQENR